MTSCLVIFLENEKPSCHFHMNLVGNICNAVTLWIHFRPSKCELQSSNSSEISCTDLYLMSKQELKRLESTQSETKEMPSFGEVGKSNIQLSCNTVWRRCWSFWNPDSTARNLVIWLSYVLANGRRGRELTLMVQAPENEWKVFVT